VRLEKPDATDGTFNLDMSPVEWEEIHALAKFALVGLDYDCKAAYVVQVFTFIRFVGRSGGFPQKERTGIRPRRQIPLPPPSNL
jgi:hypothetical protein